MPFQTRPVFDTRRAAASEFGDLPEWDLRDLYPSPDGPEFDRDMEWLGQACADFAARYEGKLASLSAADLLTCVETYEAIEITAGRLMSYAGLRYYQNTMDSERAKFMADAQDEVTTATTALVFFALEFNRLEDAHLSNLLAQNEGLARYKPVFDRMRAMRPHQLSDEMERFLHDASVVGASAWRDTHVRIVGDAVASLELIFLEDWTFARGRAPAGEGYLLPPTGHGSVLAQIVSSGPDPDATFAIH